jgi:hypothetical protein
MKCEQSGMETYYGMETKWLSYCGWLSLALVDDLGWCTVSAQTNNK